MPWKKITELIKFAGITPWFTGGEDGDERAIYVHDASGTVLTPEVSEEDHHDASSAADALEKFYNYYRERHGPMRATAVDKIAQVYYEFVDKFHRFRSDFFRGKKNICDHCGNSLEAHAESKDTKQCGTCGGTGVHPNPSPEDIAFRDKYNLGEKIDCETCHGEGKIYAGEEDENGDVYTPENDPSSK